MYLYSEFDRQFVRARAAQFRDQLERWQAGKLSDEEFRPLRLQNGWYIQRYAPMTRISVPYGELSSRQLRALARVAREYDRPDAALLHEAQQKQSALGPVPVREPVVPRSEVTTPMWRSGRPPSSVESASIILGKLAASDCCSSIIEGELSMTNRMSRSRSGIALSVVTS